MNPEVAEDILSGTMNDVATHVRTTSLGRREVTVQFTMPWRIDRPYHGIKSAVVVDGRGRLEELSLRPGPVEQRHWSKEQAEDLLADAAEVADAPVPVDTVVKDHYGELWRTHVESDGDVRSGEVVDWILRFHDEYDRLHAARRHEEPESVPEGPYCWNCEDAPAKHVFTAHVTERERLHVAVCTECSPDIGGLPFIQNSLARDFNRRGGVQITTADGTFITGVRA